MEIPPPDELLERMRSLPAGGPLLARLAKAPQTEPTETAQSAVYLVGGSVRDLLLGDEPSELDLVVEGDGQALIKRLGGQVVRHERFGTWTVNLDGFSYDVAQARREHYPAPGALPEVEPASLEEDLRRRDFTVNALAIGLTGRQAGQVFSAPLGVEDLDGRRLRILHPASFVDDPTRLFRLARYQSRLGFRPEADTASRAHAAVDNGAVDTLSGSRVGSELRLLALERDPLAALNALREFGADAAVHPQLALGDADIALGRRADEVLPDDGRRDRLALALAFRDVPAEELRALLDRLSFEAEDRQAILAAVTQADEVARALSGASRPSQIAEAARGWPAELIAIAAALGPEPQARSWLSELRHVGLEITGDDLIRAGVPTGPGVGLGLRAALNARLDGDARDRNSELEVALSAARGGA